MSPRQLAAAIAILCALPAMPVQAQAESVGVSPGRLEFLGAQAGESYHGTVSLQNQFDSESTFTVDLAGDAGAWAVTSPQGPFTIPARSAQAVEVTIRIPVDAGPGNRTGEVRFVSEPKGDPNGAGGGVRIGVTVLLAVEVGGEAVTKIVWLTASAPDTQAGNVLRAQWLVRNDGNVRTLASAHATVTPMGGGVAVAQGNGSLQLDPGQTRAVVVELGSALPIGQYTIRLDSVAPATGSQATVEAKVVPVGTEAPNGFLRAISNPVRVKAGEPVTFTAWFENTGTTPIASARVAARVTLDGAVVATLGTESAAVPSHTSTNLTFVWTPAKAGNYHIIGHAEYDGYKTPETESLLEVNPATGNLWLFIGLVALAIVALVVILVLVRRRRPPTQPPLWKS